jgi:iron complex outermembrane recepter protein
MRSKASSLVFLLVVVGLAVPVLAQQTGTVSGTLTNSLSGDVVPNALIVLEGALGSRQVRTGSDGKFSFAGVPPGSYHLVARADGYLPLRSELTVTAGVQASDLRINPELHFSEVTSVSPEGKSAFESFRAADVLGGQELTKELQGTLGATIESQPGIALRSFGPGPARPVVRGLDGDRVLIVEDGLRMGDLSSQSGDHGVNVNPAAATSIEVVRGPATLLYGSNAIGGLVNVVTNEIPKNPVKAATGTFSFDATSNADQAAGAGDVTVGNGRIALHLSGSGRRSGDYQTPEGDKPLTRMPPLRGRAGLRFQRNAFQAGADGVSTAKQDRIYTIDTPDGPVGDTPTDGYNLLKLYASYSFVSGKTTSTITAQLDNATDALYRNHLNTSRISRLRWDGVFESYTVPGSSLAEHPRITVDGRWKIAVQETVVHEGSSS